MKIYIYITKHVVNIIKIILKKSSKLRFKQNKIKMLENKNFKVKILKNDLEHMKYYTLDYFFFCSIIR